MGREKKSPPPPSIRPAKQPNIIRVPTGAPEMGRKHAEKEAKRKDEGKPLAFFPPKLFFPPHQQEDATSQNKGKQQRLASRHSCEEAEEYRQIDELMLFREKITREEIYAAHHEKHEELLGKHCLYISEGKRRDD